MKSKVLLEWGVTKENSIWIGWGSYWRFLFRGHDALYISAGRLRLRLMTFWQR